MVQARISHEKVIWLLLLLEPILKNNLNAHGGVAKLEFLNLTSNTDISNVSFTI